MRSATLAKSVDNQRRSALDAMDQLRTRTNLMPHSILLKPHKDASAAAGADSPYPLGRDAWDGLEH